MRFQSLLRSVSISSILLLLAWHVTSFVQQHAARTFVSRTVLHDGYGVATNYTWKEEAYELEVTVSVPPDTRAKDIQFKAKPRSIDLRLNNDKILLNGSRDMRGRISMDGTFWVLSDAKDKERQVTVTIEKSIVEPKDDFEVVDYDWKGVYPNDEDEVSVRKYQEAEELNVREYAASLGVDIDNINMSMVDKTMFSSGLNLTRSTMDQLSKSGYVQEVTQQSDGAEYITKDDGKVEPFSRLGDTVADDELEREVPADTNDSPPKIPFLDTDSPWQKTVPADKVNEDGTLKEPVKEVQQAVKQKAKADVSSSSPDAKTASDPIDMLTVKRMKEILRTEGLKVSGSKKELQERLRALVQTKLKTDDDDDDEA